MWVLVKVRVKFVFVRCVVLMGPVNVEFGECVLLNRVCVVVFGIAEVVGVEVVVGVELVSVVVVEFVGSSLGSDRRA